MPGHNKRLWSWRPFAQSLRLLHLWHAKRKIFLRPALRVEFDLIRMAPEKRLETEQTAEHSAIVIIALQVFRCRIAHRLCDQRDGRVLRHRAQDPQILLLEFFANRVPQRRSLQSENSRTTTEAGEGEIERLLMS